MGFHSNVIGGKFGRGGEPANDWICICDAENRYWLVNCQMCGISKKLALEAQEKDANEGT